MNEKYERKEKYMCLVDVLIFEQNADTQSIFFANRDIHQKSMNVCIYLTKPYVLIDISRLGFKALL